MSVQKEIKNYLFEEGIKQTAIARKLGISTSTLSSMLAEARRMSVEEYVAICEAIKVKPAFFIDKSIDILKGKER